MQKITIETANDEGFFMHEQTTRCIAPNCGKTATRFSGHVHLYVPYEGPSVIAGRCEEHEYFNGTSSKCQGCYGMWKPYMGFTLLIEFADRVQVEDE